MVVVLAVNVCALLATSHREDVAGPAGGGVWAAAAALGDLAGDSLADALERRATLKRERDALNKRIRNQEKKRVRLLEKARSLTDADLVNLIATRAAAKANAKAKAKAKAKAAA